MTGLKYSAAAGENLNNHNRINIIPIFYLILLLILLSFLPSVEPFFTITNNDQYTHTVNASISSENGEYSWQGQYVLEPGETVEVKKPVSLIFKWIKPAGNSSIFYSSSGYEYFIASEEKEYYVGIEPGISTTIYFELLNESQEFEIKIAGTGY